MLAINLGCGDNRAPAPWVDVDQYSGPGVYPDVVASAIALPFPDGSADKVYVGHLLEHLEWETDLPAVLKEIRGILAPGGKLCVVGPDYDLALSNPEWHSLIPGIVEGGHRWPGDEHQWLSSGPKTLDAIVRVFPNAEQVDITKLPGWPVVDTVGWQFAILA